MTAEVPLSPVATMIGLVQFLRFRIAFKRSYRGQEKLKGKAVPLRHAGAKG